MKPTSRYEWLDAVLASDLPHRAVRIGAFLFARAKSDTGATWQSSGTIATRCNLTRRNVKAALRQLQDSGFLRAERPAGDLLELILEGNDGRRDRVPNVYVLAVNGVSISAPRKDVHGVSTATPRTTATGCQNAHERGVRSDTQTNTLNKHSSFPPTPQKKSRRKKFDPTDFAFVLGRLPDAFSSDRFRSAWAEWVAHRAEIHKPLTERAIRLQLRKLAGVTPDQAIEAIETAIASRWQGLFPGKTNGANRNANGKVSGTYQHPNSREKFRLVAEAGRR